MFLHKFDFRTKVHEILHSEGDVYNKGPSVHSRKAGPVYHVGIPTGPSLVLCGTFLNIYLWIKILL